MEYNDEQLLSPKEYEQLAKAYSLDMKKRDFAFVRLDKTDNTPLLKEIFETMNLIKSSLLALGNFLGTGALYTLNEQQIQNLELLFGVEHEPFPCHVGRDKTKCFLNYLSLESKLLQKLKKLVLLIQELRGKAPEVPNHLPI